MLKNCLFVSNLGYVLDGNLDCITDSDPDHNMVCNLQIECRATQFWQAFLLMNS